MGIAEIGWYLLLRKGSIISPAWFLDYGSWEKRGCIFTMCIAFDRSCTSICVIFLMILQLSLFKLAKLNSILVVVGKIHFILIGSQLIQTDYSSNKKTYAGTIEVSSSRNKNDCTRFLFVTNQIDFYRNLKCNLMTAIFTQHLKITSKECGNMSKS